MKNLPALGLAAGLLASGLAYADCRKCHDTLREDLAACAKIGDSNARANCETRANETFNSCAKGFNCK